MCSRDAALCAYLTLSLTHAPAALSLSLARSLAHSLPHSARRLPLPLYSSSSSSLLSSSSYITGYVCVSCRSLIALRAVCNHWKGFPASVRKVEFTDGNTIHPAPQAQPPSLAILPSIHIFYSPPQPVFLSSLLSPLQAHTCDGF